MTSIETHVRKLTHHARESEQLLWGIPFCFGTIFSNARYFPSSKINEKLEELENCKNDSTKMYKAIKALKITEGKKKLIVHNESEEIATSEEDQVELITTFFKTLFTSDEAEEIPHLEPKEMTTPFSAQEVREAIETLKNNKSPGCDDINGELLKYGPEEINQEIADILNKMASTGQFPTEIKDGILIPLPKPGKKAGPPANLRPIILLSTLRKILAMCLLRRINDRLNDNIPLTQAAYRAGRSTTENVFTFKTLAEKAITSANYETYIIMLDMSKAFDSVKRKTLYEDLQSILNEDELHMITILLKDVRLKTRCGKTTGEYFKTNIGVPQGDCLSPILFTLYLAKALEEKPNQKVDLLQDHNYGKPAINAEEILPDHLKDHTYCSKTDPFFCVDQQYADDISWVANNKCKIDTIKDKIPQKLKERNLKVNQSKTEQYEIKRNGNDESWRKCKYLGTLLDTAEDISRRKQLSMMAYNKLKFILDSKKTSIQMKIRIFNSFIASIFLYNSELWTLSKKLEHKIDVFHRSMLRRLLKIIWKDKITNEELYEKTNQEKWSETIKKRRLHWFGHLMRLPDETTAKQALRECERKTRKPQGRPKLTWLKQIRNQIEEMKLNYQDIETLTSDRFMWRTLIDEGAMSTTMTSQA